MRTVLATLFGLALATQAWAGPVTFAWPDGHQAAVALTYDDATSSQLDVAIPQLDAAGLKATFFLTAVNMNLESLARWRTVAAEGHELGNHTIFHPCARGRFPMPAQYNDESYSVQTMLNEIRVMNMFLFAIDGRSERTYASPCGQTVVGDEDYSEALRLSRLVRYMRGYGPNADGQTVFDPRSVDLFHVPSRFFDKDVTGAQLIAFVEQVRLSGGGGVIVFHGVGGNWLRTSAQAHEELVDYLAAHQRDIWVATFGELMDYVAAHRQYGVGSLLPVPATPSVP
jgi:peptidoglycan/xylan/chitin deacetylase (PgdA/CDA1 family)